MATILDLKISQPGGPGASSDPEEQSSGAAAPQAHQIVGGAAEKITLAVGAIVLIVFGLHIAERAIKKHR